MEEYKLPEGKKLRIVEACLAAGKNEMARPHDKKKGESLKDAKELLWKTAVAVG